MIKLILAVDTNFLEVRAISNYEKRYKNAKKKRAQDLQEKKEIEAQIARLEKQKEAINQRITQDENAVIATGLLYYNQEKRQTVLKDAEKLCYSKANIIKLRQEANDENWNTDTVGIETLHELDVMEQYIGDNASWWEKSPLSKFGSLFNRESEDAP